MTVGMTAAIVFSTLSCCCLYDSGLPTPLLLRSRCFLSMALIASATESHEPPLPRKPAPGEELLDEAFGTSLDILFFLPRFGTGIGVMSLVGVREDELPLLPFTRLCLCLLLVVLMLLRYDPATLAACGVSYPPACILSIECVVFWW